MIICNFLGCKILKGRCTYFHYTCTMNRFIRSRFLVFLMLFFTQGMYAQIHGETAIDRPIKVIVFYSTACPICQKMTLTLNRLATQYKDSDILFEIVFPSALDTKKDIAKFKKRFHITTSCIQDSQNQLVNKYNATVTPECFVIDNYERVLYSGKIDNWFYDIGKYRQVITENYLQDAISAILNQQLPKITRTEPIGCFITK